MLVVNPDFRISTESVLKHPWFTQEEEYNLSSSSSPTSSLISTEGLISENLTQEQIDSSVKECANESVLSSEPNLVEKKVLLNAFDLASIMMSGIVNPLVQRVTTNQVTIRRETRFIAGGDKHSVLEKIKSTLSDVLQVKVSTTHLGDSKLSQQNSDHNFADLKCFATIQQVGLTFSVKIEATQGGFCLVEFRRGKGSIIDYNNLYRQILNALPDLVMSQSSEQ